MNKNAAARKHRARRVRRKVLGTAERPRLCVFRSNKNIFVQFTDDVAGVSLLGVSSQSPELKGSTVAGGKTGMAKEVGKLAATKARERNITTVVFDRNGYLYHGRVKAVAEGAREAGLQF